MEEFVKEIEERIKHLQKDVNVVSLAKISELTLVNKRLKQLLIHSVVVPNGTLCDDCKKVKTDTVTLCKKCYLNDLTV